MSDQTNDFDLIEYAAADKLRRISLKWLWRLALTCAALTLILQVIDHASGRPTILTWFGDVVSPISASASAKDFETIASTLEIPRIGYNVEKTNKNQKRFTRSDLNCIARAIYHDGADRPAILRHAFAQVIVNRVFSDNYPNSACNVVYFGIGLKYGCLFKNACDSVGETADELERWTTAIAIARDVVLQKSSMADRVSAATFFVEAGAENKLTSRMYEVVSIRGFDFYSEAPVLKSSR